MDTDNFDEEEKIDTIEGLARMTARGFSRIEQRLDKVEERLSTLEHGQSALKATVENYINLSEKRYFELKQRDQLLAGWIEQIAKQTGIAIDTSVLEKM